MKLLAPAIALVVAAALGAGLGSLRGSAPAEVKEPRPPARRAPQQAPVDMPGIPVPARTDSGFFHAAPSHVKRPQQHGEAARIAADTPYKNASRPAPFQSGVLRLDPEAVQDGLNLVVSGHRPEAALMTMKGQVLHTWSYEFTDVWPEPLDYFEWAPHKTMWRRAHVYPNGDLLAIFEGVGMIKLAADSKLLWSYDGRCHHDIAVLEDGRIVTLARAPRLMPGLKAPLLEDFVVVLSPDGEELQRVSLLDAMLESRFASLVALIPNMSDVFHANAAKPLDGSLADRIPAFAAGRVLVSLRNIDTIAVIDLDRGIATWAMTGPWHLQHEPMPLPNGHLLVFDNLGLAGATRVIEIDPATKEIVWSFAGTAAEPFDSPALGACARLANGNTLITESISGRAIEVTPKGGVVWEYVNPHRGGAQDELIATLCDVVRIDWNALDLPVVRAAREQRGQPVDTGSAGELLRGGDGR